MATGLLNGKVTLITGASSGIGRATALVMAAHGASVVVSARTESACISLCDEIITIGGEAAYIKADVTEDDQVQAMVEYAVERYGKLDCAVNNAGGQFQSNEEWPEANPMALQQTFDLNVKGVWLCMKYELKQMLVGGSGAIVNLSSVAGTRTANNEAYSSSKYAVNGLTRSAAYRYGRQGIRVNSVAPGIIEAGVWKTRFEAEPDMKGTWDDVIPIGRTGRPEEVGEAIAWLCSDLASYITGAVLPVDGGNAITINIP